MDNQFMRRALELAGMGAGRQRPNPMVGAVIVRDGQIIGEGYHREFGGNHAEVEAFLDAGEDVRGADMYVTLEPCSHTGKTPPCADKILEMGIRRVFVGIPDPNPLVSGGGIRRLRQGGVEVTVGILEKEGQKLNEVFLKYITTGLPFCVMKTAMTLDGKIAAHTGDARWVTGPESRRMVYRLRHRCAAILVGIGTVLEDDPRLTTRLEEEEGRDPVRVIVDSNARTPPDARALIQGSKAPVLIAVAQGADPDRVASLEARGAKIIHAPGEDGRVELPRLFRELGGSGLDSVLLEGGSELNASALEAGLVDKVCAFVAPKIVGGRGAKTPVGGRGKETMSEALPLREVTARMVGGDILVEGYTNIQRGEDAGCSQD